MQIHPMWADYPTLAPELVATLDLIETKIAPDSVPVKEALLQMINAGGKLLRPAYCLLFSQFKETDREKMIALAAAVETLHTATLVHDDIIDRAATRRNQKTVAAQFGPDVAVYAGDYLFVVCFKLLAQYASSLRSVQKDGTSMERILNGELAQMATRYNYDITIDQYLHQVSGKTGQLFALSCFIGAYEGGNSLAFAKRAETIGLNIGIAFQLRDDILDYTSDATSFGKPVHEDIKQGVYSAPLILAMNDDRAAFRPLLSKKQTMQPEDMRQIATLMSAHDGVAKAQAMAQTYTDKALAGLAKLPAGAAKDTLVQLTQQLLNRQN
ncbi:polyprenyl synthetase family protein [Lacticaseibacillus yichunensis]|uniref:Polyprenyl synthetase family protein n=1 Tax=Lacticaseibacillus yichunensis TaxID=2486015 RepID=A0ABW4CMS1_9LACO|nr:polyprenyl synthetase family protein [Lacticaseibacillus yichunensis]